MDFNVTPKHDVPLWNETRWNGCWNADEGVGLYLHMGRFRHDLDMWWGQIGVYLPDQQLCVQRIWGRNTAAAGCQFAGLDLRMTEDGWTCTFDGVGELTDIVALSENVRGASAPSTSMAWQVEAKPATPVWDQMAEKGSGEGPLHAGDAHVQQGYETTGTLRVGGKEFRLDGIGFKDHSSGTRDFGPWRSHQYLQIVGPEWTAHLISMAGPDGDDMPPMGAFFRRSDGKQETITRFDLPRMTDPSGGPIEGDLVFEIGSGERFEFTTELLHAFPIGITEDNDNMNGINWDLPDNLVILCEGKGRLAAPDGTVLHCFHERTMRRNLLERGPSPFARAKAT